MRYEGTVYRPPSEAYSLIIQATIGCPHNQCAFCALYKKSKFKIRPVKDIKEDLVMARDYYGDTVKTVFFADGNTIMMPTKDLVDIFSYAHQLFSKLERITLYGSVRFILRKSLSALKQLKAAGLLRIHCGMESGDNEVLQLINKGSTAAEIIKASLLVKEAGIKISEYIIVGIGGRQMWQQHAINSAQVLNKINPDFIRLRTFMPCPGTLLYQKYKQGEFKLLTAHQALRETALFVETLADISSNLLSDHPSNYCDVSGKLPAEKSKMLKEIAIALTIDGSKFRNPETVCL